MTVFADTSALYSLMDADDQDHTAAGEVWARLVLRGEALITSNYVLVETIALVQNRMGPAAVRDFQDGITPLLRVLWIDSDVHAQAVAAVLTAGRRRLSLVDCTSFALMRRQGLDTAFAFDRHFTEQGLDVVPSEQ